MTMLDALDLPSGSSLETDICIVGAGAAGITLALELEAAGIDVPASSRPAASSRSRRPRRCTTS